MAEKAPVFDQIKKDYLRQVEALEGAPDIAETLGITADDNTWHIPFFGRTHTITPHAISDEAGQEANHITWVLLSKYLLLCPENAPQDDSLVTYKDFKDAAPYVGGFRNTASQPIATHFEGAVEALEKQCRAFGGQPFATDVSCELAFRFQALPRIPVVLLFNDADEDFPAQATLLFQQDASAYLDMECLAMVGSTLAARLKGVSLDYL
ncbi:DUF3786 domain-containing protein [Desulfoluna butyratoxydans]|uniref:DUF3786 domain-containing protein n=1 Tax=Desulfoluna butyratoxydans TaxID=231438 RepID=A0A4U8YPR9_9BACT|nr:DUF3786 domain-containing protein [Desulfoluna butyratoxydans]VFQ45791.1 domain of unknown function duf3786 [Desulfoluna butyratoxydans]